MKKKYKEIYETIYLSMLSASSDISSFESEQEHKRLADKISKLASIHAKRIIKEIG